MSGFAANTVVGSLACLLCGAILVGPPGTEGTWVGFRNNTPSVIVIQTSSVGAGAQQRGKQHILYSGETAWDNVPAAGARQITVMDPKANNQILGQQIINVSNQQILLSLQWQAMPQIPGKPPVPPALRLIPIPIVGPPGVAPPKDAPKAGPNTPIPPRAPLPPTSNPDAPATPPSNQPNLPPSAGTPNSPQSPDQPKSQQPGDQPKSTTPDQPKSAPKAPAPTPTPTPTPPPPDRRPVPPPPPKSKGG